MFMVATLFIFSIPTTVVFSIWDWDYHKHCDRELNVCFYTYGRNTTLWAQKLTKASKICSIENGILLEIYNESYQILVNKALQKWNIFPGYYLLLNLGYTRESYRWLTTGKKVKYTNWDYTVDERIYGAFITGNMSNYVWIPVLSDFHEEHPYVCMRPFQMTETTPTYQMTTSSSDEGFARRIGLGVGLPIIGLVVMTIFFILLAKILKRKKTIPPMRAERPVHTLDNGERYSLGHSDMKHHTNLPLPQPPEKWPRLNLEKNTEFNFESQSMGQRNDKMNSVLEDGYSELNFKESDDCSHDYLELRHSP